MDNNIPTQEGITLRVLLSRLLNCQPMRVSKKYSGEAWATHGKRPYTPARYEAVPSQPDAAELGRLEGAFHRSLRPGACTASLPAQGSCTTGLHGVFSVPLSARGSWALTAQHCLEQCGRCGQCSGGCRRQR